MVYVIRPNGEMLWFESMEAYLESMADWLEQDEARQGTPAMYAEWAPGGCYELVGLPDFGAERTDREADTQ